MESLVGRKWSSHIGACAIGLAAAGLSLQGAPMIGGAGLLSVQGVSSADSSAVVGTSSNGPIAVDNSGSPQTLAAPPVSPERQHSTDPDKVERFADDEVRHVGWVISSTSVASESGTGSSRGGGGLQLGEPCSCDEDCDAALGDQCNIVQCVVRSVCTGDNQTLCTPGVATDCANNGSCSTVAALLVQRCDTLPLIEWSCESGDGFCSEDRCEDDPQNPGTSICLSQDDGSGAPLSPCAKKCDGGPASGLPCNRPSECPQAACKISSGGLCDNATSACYVGASVATAVGRCCDGDSCTETDEASCSGNWYRYRDPAQQLGDGFCICPKYGSGVAPPEPDQNSIGLVRPSGLVCQVGSAVSVLAGGPTILCEDLDGDGFSPRFCLRRCVGGDNEGQPCLVDNPDCGRLGLCSVGGTPCEVANTGDDCGLCEGLDNVGCDAPGGFFQCPGGETCLFAGGQTCNASNPGECQDDPCGPNTIEGGCEDGFLSIGDDYSISNGSFFRLTEFRFRGGVTNQGEDIVFEFWDSTGTRLIDNFSVRSEGSLAGGVANATANLPLTGTRDWTIRLDCWPNCLAGQGEIPEPTPIIIPPNGYVTMRSPRTVGTVNGAAAFWSQTDAPADVGTNDNTRAWVDGDPNASIGTNVFIFELVGEKIADPLGACCDDSATCEDTVRWECGLCTLTSPPVLCASTLHDCPDGGLNNSLCQFGNWFGPTSHTEIEFGGSELTLCNGVSPCDSGACCDGETCTLETEEDCTAGGRLFLGLATNCSTNCCPVDNPTGSDCLCATSTCVVDADSTNTGLNCFADQDCEPGQSCILQCEPGGTTPLHLPFECHDDIGTPLAPPTSCDPSIGDADCPPVPCTGDEDCPSSMACLEGFCEDTLAMTCEQSFVISTATTRNDTIISTFGVAEGDGCTLTAALDNVGWHEKIELVDLTPGDGTDDCFIVTTCYDCTNPILAPIWPFINQALNCPCLQGADLDGIAPDTDSAGNSLDGYGPQSLARLAGRCEDNYAATYTLPPGEYAQQINAGFNCVGTTIPCDTAEDCPGLACVIPNPNYTITYTVESCQLAACCIGDTCIVTNVLDCTAQAGTFLGGGDQPVVSCQAGTCGLGSCCLEGLCQDDEFSNELEECEMQGGIFLGGVACDTNPCPACPYDSPTNCQQVQTAIGIVPLIDRNAANGNGTNGFAAVDDTKFGGSIVDNICWNTGFFATPCCQTGCAQNIDSTWEIRIYGPDLSCAGIPGPEIGMSAIDVLNKIAGSGQFTNNWQYSGVLATPIGLPNGGLTGDTYWFEVTGLGDPGCEVRATWSRDDGNEHMVFTEIPTNNSARTFSATDQILLDIGFCEDSGMLAPPPVLGTCCTCPGITTENITQRDCIVGLRGVWSQCDDCNSGICPGFAANDDCTAAQLVTGVPESVDGLAEITVGGDNICALDDGPGLSADVNTGQCSGSLGAGADLFDDVWYAYTATACGELRVTACDDACNDLIIAAYNGSGGCPVTSNDEIACDDDGCGVGGGPSDMTVNVTSGQELLIRVGGWNDEGPGGNSIGIPRGRFTLHWSLKLDCPAVEPPVRAPAPHAILKNRYISIDPRGELLNNSPNLHIRVTVNSSEVDGLAGSGPWWAGQPDADCISVVTTAKPAAEPNWSLCPTAHLTGCPIVPTTTYGIAAESGGELSDENLLDTQAKPGIKWHGDCVGFFSGTEWTAPNGQTSIDDAVAAIKTFQNPDRLPGCGTPPCNATHTSVTDVVPNLSPGPQINKIVNIADVFAIIQGFQGAEYPGSDLTQCP